jgi:hypothetical protein
VGAEVNSSANMQGVGLIPLLNAARGVYQGLSRALISASRCARGDVSWAMTGGILPPIQLSTARLDSSKRSRNK